MTLGRAEVRAGDRVRVVDHQEFTGEVMVDIAGLKFVLDDETGARVYLDGLSMGYPFWRQWEILGPEEPPSGSIVETEFDVFVRVGDEWFRPGFSAPYDWEDVCRVWNVTVIRRGPDT